MSDSIPLQYHQNAEGIRSVDPRRSTIKRSPVMTLVEFPHQPSEDKIVVVQHGEATEFLDVAYPTLRLHESSANILLAHALARAPVETVLTECQFIDDTDVQFLPSPTQPFRSNNFWLTVWSQRAKSPPVLDLALSCLESSSSKYPVFIWTPAKMGMQSPQWLDPRVRAMAAYLQVCVDHERVFAAFGPSMLVTTFADVWAGLTGFQINPQPLYKAFSAVCTPQDIKVTATAEQCGARKATIHDLDAAARLCQEFASSSEYPLDLPDATAEARQLIDKGQLWVGTLMGEIESICAVARSSLHVSAITKVFTTPDARRNGLAQTLVKEVTSRLFKSGKHSVMLYVGCDNQAQRVYDRVGFQIQHADIWLELGFVGTNPGHW
ncbi:N-acetyltransferase domain-containing protein [Mycena sanguinolenta]|uniref:N-acetyltransferase domain-containing protein n=1 Tax=Mycena sanguinolenta TaxID=230812 RepID=A0A8H6XBG2_9AGAR|nr:N-acetyltransferase domain-containing protein [Mycena sanguinolenta]